MHDGMTAARSAGREAADHPMRLWRRQRKRGTLIPLYSDLAIDPVGGGRLRLPGVLQRILRCRVADADHGCFAESGMLTLSTSPASSPLATVKVPPRSITA